MDEKLRIFLEEVLDLMLSDEHIDLMISFWKGMKDQGWVNSIYDAVIADVVGSSRTELSERAKVLNLDNTEIHRESYPIIERRMPELQHKLRMKLNK
jgi:hypothetical protein